MMVKKGWKISLVVVLVCLIIVCGDDETRDLLKRKLNIAS